MILHALVTCPGRDVQTTSGLRRSCIRGPDHRGNHGVDLLCEAVIFQSLIVRRNREDVDTLRLTIMSETRYIRDRRGGRHVLIHSREHQRHFEASNPRTTKLNISSQLHRFRHGIIIRHSQHDAWTVDCYGRDFWLDHSSRNR